MRFISEIWHPNSRWSFRSKINHKTNSSFHLVDKDGNVCISILHEPKDDKFGYEKASERWLPVHDVSSILISVISLLSDPNDESPGWLDYYFFFENYFSNLNLIILFWSLANVDAAKEFRENYAEFKKKVTRCVRKSQTQFDEWVIF